MPEATARPQEHDTLRLEERAELIEAGILPGKAGLRAAIEYLVSQKLAGEMTQAQTAELKKQMDTNAQYEAIVVGRLLSRQEPDGEYPIFLNSEDRADRNELLVLRGPILHLLAYRLLFSPEDLADAETRFAGLDDPDAKKRKPFSAAVRIRMEDGVPTLMEIRLKEMPKEKDNRHIEPNENGNYFA